MVRCNKCEKCYKNSDGKSWDMGICGKCAKKEDKELDPCYERLIIRLHSNPVDFYLDQYTHREIKNLKN